MTEEWEKCIRLKEPLVTRPFKALLGLAGFAMLLGILREVSGLGYVTGLNDGYAWGLFKNWNVTALTALGSGGYAVAVMAWIFNDRKFHPIMRTAVLTSLVGYGTGMLALGFDVGRPWNFIHILNPKTRNHHSVLLEVAVCMTAYVILALNFENMPPFLERMYQSGDPERSDRALKIFHYMQISVLDCPGLRASFDAPVVARFTDVLSRRPRSSSMADCAPPAALFANGLYLGLRVRFARSNPVHLRVEAGLGRRDSGPIGGGHVVAHAVVAGYPVC